MVVVGLALLMCAMMMALLHLSLSYSSRVGLVAAVASRQDEDTSVVVAVGRSHTPHTLLEMHSISAIAVRTRVSERDAVEADTAVTDEVVRASSFGCRRDLGIPAG